jgi:23S rRNA-/tRNA-specific pseudouridylate synthase
VHLALAYFPALPRTHPLEPGLLHRLDTGTSGALAFAKTSSAFSRYRSLWKSEVRKTYRAIASPSEGARFSLSKISIPHDVRWEIAHDAKSAKRMRVLDPNLELPMKQQLRRIRGKPQPAHTTLHRMTPLGPDLVDIEVQIHTGVMHQIRVHLTHLGLPLLGDELYKGQPSTRLWLHAWRLQIDGHVIEAPLPEGWPSDVTR